MCNVIRIFLHGLRDFPSSLTTLNCVILLAIIIGAQLPSSTLRTMTPASPTGIAVPFAGCRSDGQLGPRSAPNGTAMVLPIPAEAAQRLSYYKSQQGFGVLGPRDWHCFGVYGSSGEALYVSPEELTAADLFSTTWKGFKGPAIEISYEYGGTSGRFAVASTIARVFPAHREFVEYVIKEGIEPASSFPMSPFPNDRLIYKSEEIVEYQTQANEDGLGTNSRLQRDADPISGVAILIGQTPDLLSLAVRLSPKLVDLEPAIVQQVERDSTRPMTN
jgi:hypothetical protein